MPQERTDKDSALGGVDAIGIGERRIQQRQTLPRDLRLGAEAAGEGGFEAVPQWSKQFRIAEFHGAASARLRGEVERLRLLRLRALRAVLMRSALDVRNEIVLRRERSAAKRLCRVVTAAS